MKRLMLIRGRPGSAKSTLARMIAATANFSADDFFEKDGTYQFDRALIKDAHADCKERVEAALVEGFETVAVHNTFSKAWEAQAYYSLAANYDYEVFVVECQNDFGNIHGVPDEIIHGMWERWEPLDGRQVPLLTIARLRFWDRYYATKRWAKALIWGPA